MTITFNIGGLLNESSNDALVDELRKRTSEEAMIEFDRKFNSRNEKNLHVYICRFLKNRQISRSLAAKWLMVILNEKESQLKLLTK
tara:strand:+ start:495 stop:752 length:258 start_codon:yes stop_codon:yes gene_type:complete